MTRYIVIDDEAQPRYVSEAEFDQADRDADEACGRGEHTLRFEVVGGRFVAVCEDCPR